jgi:microcystin-dependent protein
MSETLPRTEVVVWDEDSDEFTRVDMTDSHQGIEDRVATFFIGASLPELAEEGTPEYARAFFLRTSDSVLFHSNNSGTQWTSVTAFGTPTGIAPGSSNTAGSSSNIARADHVHQLPGFGSPVSVSTGNAAGDAETFARSNHVHAIGTGAVSQSTMFAAGVVSDAALATDSVSTNKIAAGAVTKTKIEAAQQIPTGVIWAYAGSAAPTGWVLCDGAAINRGGANADLFALLGTTYGPGDNATTFNVPNLNNRFIRGGTPGTTGGADSVTLTTAQLPSHSHSLSGGATTQSGSHGHVISGTTDSEPNHSHNLLYGPQLLSRTNIVLGSLAGTNTGGFLSASGIVNVAQQLVANDFEADGGHSHDLLGNALDGPTSEHTHSLTGNTGSTGSGSSVSTLPAFTAMRYMIKL